MFRLMHNGFTAATFSTAADAEVAQSLAQSLCSSGMWLVEYPTLCGGREVPRYIVNMVRTLKERAPGQFSIACIKLICEHMQSGLKEAKDAFDAI